MTKNKGPTRDELNEFADLVAITKANIRPGQELPGIEVSRAIVEHFNRENLAAFDKVGYFVYGGVRVYETGRMEGSQKEESKTISERLFKTKV